MPSAPHSSNHLLQALPAADREVLRPHLGIVELVRETVLVEAGRPQTHVYLPHSGAISLMVRLSEGQTVEVATLGRDNVFGASAALHEDNRYFASGETGFFRRTKYAVMSTLLRGSRHP